VLDANQAGNASYAPAPQVQQRVQVFQPLQPQTLYWNTYPQSANVGQTWPVIATGGGSGLPVVLTVDPTSTAQCSLQPGPFFGPFSTQDLATFASVGTCTIDATQAGNSAYLPATPIQASITVTQGPQFIGFTSYPSNPMAGGSTYSVSATGGASGNPVTFSSTTPSVCSVSGSNVTFLAAGNCSIAADQAGNAGYSVAQTVIQSFFVSPALAITSPASVTFTTGIINSFLVTTTSSITVAYSVTGNLDGLTLNPVTGLLGGMPGAAGRFHLNIKVTNGIGTTAVQKFLLVVLPFHVTTTHLPDAPRGVTYTAQLAAIGGNAPLKWTAVTALPSGLHLSGSGHVFGRPSKALSNRNYSFSVQVGDSTKPTHRSATATITIRIR
jgi:hypothetical protein